MNKARSRKIIRIIIGVIIYSILIIAFYFGWHNGFIQNVIHRSGILAPIIYILVATSKAIFPVVPGEVLVVLGVVLFGPVLGLIYAFAGLTLGSICAFLLARRYGQPFVVWLLGEKRFRKINKLSGDKTLFSFFLIYLLPGTPDDLVTYIAGLTSLSIFVFIPLCVIGRLPSYLIYAVGGISIRTLNIKLLFFWWGVMFVIVSILYAYKRSLDKKKSKE